MTLTALKRRAGERLFYEPHGGMLEEGWWVYHDEGRNDGPYDTKADALKAAMIYEEEEAPRLRGNQSRGRENPTGATSYTNAALLIGIGAVVGGIAYWLWSKSQAAAADAQAPVSTGLDASGNPTSMTPPNAQGIGVFTNQTSPLGPAATYNPAFALGSRPLP
jgi:hypothetical protein